MIIQKIGILMMFTWLTSCSIIQQKPMKDIAQVTSWKIRGKVALISPQEKGSAKLYWHQQDQDFHIAITSQFGTHLLTLSQKKDYAELTDDQGVTYKAKDAQTLLKHRSPWYLPITHLQTWIKGMPGNSAHKLNKQGRLESLVQEGWLVNFNRYNNFSNYLLPEIITIHGYDSQIRLVIQEWNFD